MAATTAQDVATFIAKKFEKTSYVYQDQGVYEIRATFGNDFVYRNKSGNP